MIKLYDLLATVTSYEHAGDAFSFDILGRVLENLGELVHAFVIMPNVIHIIQIEHKHLKLVVFFEHQEQVLSIGDESLTDHRNFIKRCKLDPMECISLVNVDQEEVVFQT